MADWDAQSPLTAKALGRLGPCRRCGRPILQGQRIAVTRQGRFRRFDHLDSESCVSLRRGPSEPVMASTILTTLIAKLVIV